MVQGYCVKCKRSREMTGAKQVKLKNGRPAVPGTCSVCGTKMFKIGKMAWTRGCKRSGLHSVCKERSLFSLFANAVCFFDTLFWFYLFLSSLEVIFSHPTFS